MSSNSSKQWPLTIGFIVILISLAFTYSLSNSTSTEYPQGTSNKDSVTVASNVQDLVTDAIFLLKNTKVVIGKTCLEYKGIQDDSLLFDLYLLDLDREQAYTHKINKKKVGGKIHFGNYTYKMLKVKERYVRMKMVSVVSTP